MFYLMEDEKFIKVVEEHPKIISSDTWYEENEEIEDIRSFLCEISIAIVRTFAYNKDR